jgi:hypothetical protein
MPGCAGCASRILGFLGVKGVGTGDDAGFRLYFGGVDLINGDENWSCKEGAVPVGGGVLWVGVVFRGE